MKNPAFGEWVQTVVDQRFGGVRGQLAEAIGVTLTTVTRGIDGGTMGTDTLLRMARLTGRDPSDLLRLAQKSEWAELIESCYGAPRDESPLVREFSELARPPSHEVLVRTFLNSLRVSLAFARGELSAGDSAPPALQPATKRKRSKRVALRA